MSGGPPLVSIGLPIRNAAERVDAVVRSVLDQDHGDLELVVSDNASTDDTESVCRALARADGRIVYSRQPENIGLLPNFVFTLSRSRGSFFRWIGDDDWLRPDYVSRCLVALSQRPDALLATTQIEYTGPDGVTFTGPSYDGARLASTDPVERLEAILDAVNARTFVVDPLYALMRRDPVAAIPRRNMFQEDQVYAAKLALAAPWTHVSEVLAGRHTRSVRASAAARHLDVPAWQLRVSTSLLCREILRGVASVDLDGKQQQRAYAVVARFYVQRQANIVARRVRRVRVMAAGLHGVQRSRVRSR